MIGTSLNLDAVKAFIQIAELGSFTRAAEALMTTQSALSLRLKRLEASVGCRLLERTPRHVALSPAGAAFFKHACELVEAHDRARAALSQGRERLVIGVSDHVAGPEFPALIARLNAQGSDLLVEVRIGSSTDLLNAYDRREFQAVIVRFDDGRSDGELIAKETFGWFAGPGWRRRAGEPLPIATMPDPCGVRILATQALDESGVSWTEVFVGGGVLAVSAAVMAGLGVAALSRRMLPLGGIDVGADLHLPTLPRLPILLHSHVKRGPTRDALVNLSAAFRSAVRE